MRVKPKYELYNWRRDRTPGGVMYWGDVKNNPNFNDGDWIHTSRVEREYLEEDEPYIVTLNSIYYLKGPSFDELVEEVQSHILDEGRDANS